MSRETTIEWCDASLSPWDGCAKVSPGCAHCYAEARDLRFYQGEHWGPGAPRRKHVTFVDSARALNRRAEREGRRLRVFPSVCDPFDAEAPVEWFAEFLDVVRTTTWLDWLNLTKRPELWRERLEDVLEILSDGGGADVASVDLHFWVTKWLAGFAPENVWIGASVENQEWADRRVEGLLNIPAVIRFLSVEPMLGPVALGLPMPGEVCANCGDGSWCEGRRRCCDDPLPVEIPVIDWVICGGESGIKYRPMDVEWARSLRDQCAAAGVPFFMKQLGGWPNKRGALEDLPEDLRVREFPGVAP